MTGQMRRQNLHRVAWVVFGAVLLGSLVIAVCGLRDDLAPADVGLVLGSKVERDGTPSRGLRARLDRTVDCYRAGCFPQIVVSGGLGKEGYDEAAVMDAYLIAAGVPADRIFSDNQGNTTYASAKNLHHLAQEHRWQTVMVITQYFHVPRARLALRHFGFAQVSSAHARCFEWRDFYSLPRECIAVPFYALRGYPKE